MPLRRARQQIEAGNETRREPNAARSIRKQSGLASLVIPVVAAGKVAEWILQHIRLLQQIDELCLRPSRHVAPVDQAHLERPRNKNPDAPHPPP